MKNKSTPMKIFIFLFLVLISTVVSAQDPNIVPLGALSNGYAGIYGMNGSYREWNSNSLVIQLHIFHLEVPIFLIPQEKFR